HHSPWAYAVVDASGDLHHAYDADRLREGRQARLKRREAHLRLKKKGEQKEHAHHSAVPDDLGQIHRPEQPIAKEADVDHRFSRPNFLVAEQQQEADTKCAKSEDALAAKAIYPCLGQRVYEGSKAGGRQDKTRDVDPSGARLLLLAKEEPRENETQEAHGDVDQEDPAPIVVFDQIAAEHRATGRRHNHRHHEYRRSFRAFLRRERAKEHRSADGREDASTRALKDAKCDERFDVPGERAEQRAGREDEERNHEDAFRAETVAGPTADWNEHSEAQKVAGDYPLDRTSRFLPVYVQVFAEFWQRDVHARHVEQVHEKTEHEDDADD